MDPWTTSEEEKEFRQEVRLFLEKEVSEEVIRERKSPEGMGPHYRGLLRKMGKRGWLTPTWPKKYGGLEGTNMQRVIVYDEQGYFLGDNPQRYGSTVAGPTILLYGTEEQKESYLPKIASGEVDFALGYTEPGAGSDLAALDIRAAESGDYYILNGQKSFNTACHWAEYHWLAARTEITAPKHRGISLFIVDLKTPGITIRPMFTMEGTRTNEVFYDNVRVPRKNLVGDKNRGFRQVTTALEFERLSTTGDLRYMIEKLIKYATETHLSNKPLLRAKLTDRAIELDVARLLTYKIAWMMDRGESPGYLSSMQRLYISELMQRIAQTGMDLLGLYMQLDRGSKWAQLGGEVAEFYQRSVRRTITGGTSEIQRNIIAIRGLKLPRSDT